MNKKNKKIIFVVLTLFILGIVLLIAFRIDLLTLSLFQKAPNTQKSVLDKTLGKITISGKEKTFPTQKCKITETEGGASVYSLYLNFIDESKEEFNYIYFSVQDAKNDRNNLLTAGTHTATGKHWDRISNHLQGSSFSWIVESEAMEIVLEKIGDSKSRFAFIGEGYIRIKTKIERPGYKDYYPPQTIFFSNAVVLASRSNGINPMEQEKVLVENCGKT